MAQVEQIKAELERQIEELCTEYQELAKYEVWKTANDKKIAFQTLKSFLSFIESMEKEQEQGVADIQREWYNKGYLKGRKEAHIPARELGLPSSLDDDSPKIKGWVARNGRISGFGTSHSESLVFFETKPYRAPDSKEWYGTTRLYLDEIGFSNLKWEDEPIEVELTIHRV